MLAGAASIAAVYSTRLRQLPGPRFDRIVTAAFLASRLALFAIVFLVLRIAPRGDVPAYYWEEALSALHGLLPYRDFASSYAPLHPYLDALPVIVWHSPLAIILLAVLVEAALLPLWLRFGRELLSEQELRTGVLLYLTSAISLQFVAVDGQDTVIISVLLTLALFFMARYRELLSGASVGISVAAIKFLPLIYAPVFFLAAPRRWRWALGFAVPIAAVYGTFIALRLPILTPLSQEGNLKCAGNIPFLVESLLGIDLPSRLWDALLMVTFAFIFFQVWKASRRAALSSRLHAITFAASALTLALVLFSKKSWPPYLMLALFPICLLPRPDRRAQVISFAAFSLIAVTEHSYWSTLLYQLTSQDFHRGLLSGQSAFYLFLAMQLLLLGGYGWLLSSSVRRISTSALVAPQEIPPTQAPAIP